MFTRSHATATARLGTALLGAAALMVGLAGVAYAGGGTVTGTVNAHPHKYLKDTFVYIKTVPGVKASPKTVTMDQKAMEFEPHLLVIQAGDSVKFLNSDKVQHDVMSPEGGYDLGKFGPGQSRTHKFTKVGVESQLCKVHPEMLAYVFVGQNPYAAAVDANGHFSIAGVPPGTYELDVWNPKLKAAGQKITVTAAGNVTANFEIKR